MNFFNNLPFDDQDIREENYIRNILKEKLKVKRLIASVYNELRSDNLGINKYEFKVELIKRGVKVKD